ncbi:MAG TPA: fructose-specific PTS transporter subunit EIIC [Rubrobacter sp.]|nr:fructose-specific PTS transporter subunit EIIC [Rubrobacter sp.]
MKFVGVTACPTGIAHSAMAAEALETKAKEMGHEIEIEIHGASGAEFVDPQVIRDADAIIIASDATVSERNRFDGKPTVEVRLREAMDKPGEVIERAMRAAEKGAAGAATDAAAQEEAEDEAVPTDMGGTGWGAEVRRWLMTGVSYMIPFVVAGGILIALAFALGGAVQVTETDVYKDFTIPAMIFKIGSTAFGMLVPILAGFIAYAMADRPGIAPGVVGGLIANEIGAGFLGGIVAGLLAGAVIILLKKIKLPGGFGRLMPILVYPLVGCLVVGALMITVLGQPIAALTTGLQNWLGSLEGANSILLGIILGSMMAFDMGGPVNKAAYAFAIAGLAGGAFGPMAAVMAAGMTPPLALALATAVRGKLFTPAEQRAGQANWVMGASFITEGAIPFAAADPLRVIPSMMVGSAITASLSLAFGATLRAPHGGIFVIGLIGNWPLYLLAIAIGTVVSAALVIVAKGIGRDTKGEAAAS